MFQRVFHNPCLTVCAAADTAAAFFRNFFKLLCSAGWRARRSPASLRPFRRERRSRTGTGVQIPYPEQRYPLSWIQRSALPWWCRAPASDGVPSCPGCWEPAYPRRVYLPWRSGGWCNSCPLPAPSGWPCSRRTVCWFYYNKF